MNNDDFAISIEGLMQPLILIGREARLPRGCHGSIFILYSKRSYLGGGGYFHIYAYWVCAARETPIFSPKFLYVL